ncbi:MAG TPA: hypothetical protein VGG19_11495 [Tepidisphaeraceae bacterium]|jgi:hypothetical protein
MHMIIFAKKQLSISLLVIGFLASSSNAVIVYTDPGRLTTAPTGKLANPGWDLQGQWAGAYSGTPIAPNYFISASHIGGSVGGTFTLNGTQYTTTAEYKDPSSDLVVWKIDGTFPTYATIDTKKNEGGKQAVIYGRGTDRGDAVTVKNQIRGWQWGTADDSLSWGANTLKATTVDNENLLEFSFKANKSHPDEASISTGDSGGGVFIKVGKTWELAGINFSTSGSYSYDPSFNDAFNASVFNAKGLYTFTDNDQPIPITRSITTTDYATRISTESKWIDSVIDGQATPNLGVDSALHGVPEPATMIFIFLLPLMMRRRGSGTR